MSGSNPEPPHRFSKSSVCHLSHAFGALLKGANQLPLVIEGARFTDGVATQRAENRAARSSRVTRD
jgi:hypothetical protein